jgi:hypothetical protein
VLNQRSMDMDMDTGASLSIAHDVLRPIS